MNTAIFSHPEQHGPAAATPVTPTQKSSRDAGFMQTEKPIDLNDQLIKNKAATFFLKVHSNAMIDAGIRNGDVVIVDRSVQPQNGAIIIAALLGELVIRRYELNEGKIVLVPASSTLSSINVDYSAGFEVWGVVTYVIRSLDKD